MNTIIIQTKDGYMAENETDDLRWGGNLDKKIFRICSVLSNINICSLRTYSLLPEKMRRDKYRQFIIAEKTGINSLIELEKKYPAALLIGGPTILMAAKKMKILETIIINTINRKSKEKNEAYKTPFTEDELIKVASICMGENLETNIYKCIYK